MTWLASGMPPAHRVSALVAHLASLGWALRWRSGRISYANPLTRNVVVSLRHRDALDIAALLAHEATHVRQLGAPWWRRWGRGVLYLLSRRRRLAMEVEARAHECALWLAAGHAPDYDAGSLAGWRWPYFTGADAAEVEAAVRDEAARIVAESE